LKTKRKTTICLFAALIGIAALIVGPRFFDAQPAADEDLESPRIAALAKQLAASNAIGDRAAVDELRGQEANNRPGGMRCRQTSPAVR
jgi:hypothetical protein